MNCTVCNKSLTGKQTLYCSKTCKMKTDNNKNQNYLKQQERAKKRKLQAISEHGGGCNKCGYSKNYSALVFHHKDPSQKDFGLDSRKFSNCSMEKIRAELAKCELLCHNCHSEHHHPDCTL